ncbi:MAG: transporter substrate-binding domain-containing protein [Campylobacterota bacterium]|nr:transporter substrate-binding domain-containing protein [Campylobacterota bacterium]
MYRFSKSILFLFFIISSFYTTLNADKLQDIKNKGYVTIGVKEDFEPFGFINKNGKLDGFDHDLARYIASYLNVRLELKIVNSKNRILKLKNNEVDIVIASMTHTIQRDKEVDYSISYYFDGLSILTTKYIKINHHFGFNGKKVGVIRGSSAAKTFKQKVRKAQIIRFNNYKEALDSIAVGKIDAISTDSIWCKLQAKKSNGKLRVLKKLLSHEPYGIAIKENESNLLDQLNFAIQSSVNDGTYIELYKKWFHENPSILPETWE